MKRGIVTKIVEAATSGNFTQRKLAAMFGTSQSQISRILNGQRQARYSGLATCRPGNKCGIEIVPKKLDEFDVRVIRRLLALKIKRAVIAFLFGVRDDTVGDIARERRWKHIQGSNESPPRQLLAYLSRLPRFALVEKIVRRYLSKEEKR